MVLLELLRDSRVTTGILGFPLGWPWEAQTSPRGSRETGMSGKFWGSHEGCQVPFRTSGRNLGLPLRRCSGQGPHIAKTLEPRVFSRVAAGFSSDDGDYRLPPLLALGSPVFHLIGEGKLGVALESLQGQRDLI